MHVLSCQFRQFTVFVIHLYLVDNVSREIIERGLYVSAKKVFSTDEQFLYRFSVHRYPAVFQFRARQLFHKLAQRFCLHHIEGISIVHERIPFVEHFDSSGFHHNFPQLLILGFGHKINIAHIQLVLPLRQTKKQFPSVCLKTSGFHRQPKRIAYTGNY